MIIYIIIILVLCTILNSKNDNNNISINNDLNNLKNNFNQNITNYIISDKYDNLIKLFNYIFYNSYNDIKLLNIEKINNYTIDRFKYYIIIFNTNYGYIEVKLVSDINKLLQNYKYQPDTISYIEYIKLLKDYRPIYEYNFKIFLEKYKEENLNFY